LNLNLTHKEVIDFILETFLKNEQGNQKMRFNRSKMFYLNWVLTEEQLRFNLRHDKNVNSEDLLVILNDMDIFNMEQFPKGNEKKYIKKKLEENREL